MVNHPESIYRKLQHRAMQLASRLPPPDFYIDFQEQVNFSTHLFHTDEMVLNLRQVVADMIDNDFGHGVYHSEKVAMETGALMMIELRMKATDDLLPNQLRLAHSTGLLHDIRRKQKHHAMEGAKFAEKILQQYPFSEVEVADICIAIRNHEAFCQTFENRTRQGALLSDCLYDADKFRFGPENFTTTLWVMLSFFDTPFDQFISRYPEGMDFLRKIRESFRTKTGRLYGPKFIDQGLAIGEELFRYIQSQNNV